MAEQSPAMAFIVARLKENPAAAYGSIQAAAEAAGFKIYPIMYGRAKSLLGLITEGRTKQRKAREAAQRGDGSRRLRQGTKTATSAISELSDWVEKYKDMEDERNRYRAALLHVEKILRGALEE